jgi:hypothetical protein
MKLKLSAGYGPHFLLTLKEDFLEIKRGLPGRRPVMFMVSLNLDRTTRFPGDARRRTLSCRAGCFI